MSNNIHVVNLSKYTSPSIEENKSENIVEYGDDNNYFQYLIDRFTKSTTNNSIIRGVSNMIYGKGLDALDSSKKPEQYASMRILLKPKELRRVISDRKKLGMGALQITYNKGKVASVTHFPMETLRAGICNDKGEVDTWYYHPNWIDRKRSDELVEFKSFGHGNNKGNEIYIITSYCAGFKYYQPVDYVGALPYAFLEEEIADYLINDTLNGFSGTKVVNFNNGIPDVEKQREIKLDVTRKFTGARGEKVIVAFNNSAESATTVEDLPLNDAPAHYQYLSDECRNKLITGHNVTSPLLLGVRESGGGLGSNAEEIKNSSLFFDNIVIKPFQEEIIEALNEILAVNDISLKLYFKTIQPLEFIETDGLDSETKEEETGVKMAKDNESFNDEEMLDALNGETVDDEWELVDTREYSEDNESTFDWAKRLIKEKLSIIQKLSGFIKSAPNGESALDKSYYKIRYTYQERYSSDKSREFCKKMVGRTSNGVVYRKEDIDIASFQGVNKSFGHKGQNYSLFRFKGGVNCGHYWQEELYRLKDKSEKYISKGEEVDSIPDSYTTKGSEYQEAKIAPKDMPNNGHHPNYKS